MKLLFGDGRGRARRRRQGRGADRVPRQQAVTAADLDAEVARHELLAFWTSDVAAPVELQDVLDEPPSGAPPLLASAHEAPFLRRPEFALLDAQRDGFLAAVRRARAERRPQLNLTFQYGFDALQLRRAASAAGPPS